MHSISCLRKLNPSLNVFRVPYDLHANVSKVLEHLLGADNVTRHAQAFAMTLAAVYSPIATTTIDYCALNVAVVINHDRMCAAQSRTGDRIFSVLARSVRTVLCMNMLPRWSCQSILVLLGCTHSWCANRSPQNRAQVSEVGVSDPHTLIASRNTQKCVNTQHTQRIQLIVDRCQPTPNAHQPVVQIIVFTTRPD